VRIVVVIAAENSTRPRLRRVAPARMIHNIARPEDRSEGGRNAASSVNLRTPAVRGPDSPEISTAGSLLSNVPRAMFKACSARFSVD
jgi:hypothetical protein